jgi:Melibiase
VRIVEPGSEWLDGPWTVYEWPADDRQPDGELLALRLPLPVRSGTPYIRNGWQSWSAPTRGRLGGSVVRLPVRTLTVGCRHLVADPTYDGDESYDVLAAEGFVAGFTHGGGVLVARPRHGDLLAIRERGAPGGHPPVWTAEGDAEKLTADLFSRLPGRVPAATPLGWSSRSVGGESYRLTDAQLAADLMGAAELRAQGLLDAFHVDDGWQADVGDWDETAPSLAGFAGRWRDPKTLADRIGDAGLAPGLWIAPFCAAPHSRLVAAHPEWVLRDARGAPVPVMDVPWWGGVVWALDVTRPDVLAWLIELGHRIAQWGVAHLKVDFVYAAALPGQRHRPATAEAAVRTALSALRRGVGDGVLLTGCGSPLWPALGVVDCMRVGPDVTAYWSPRSFGGVEDTSAACLENCWRAARLRSGLHGLAWANDPDAVLLRSTTELTPEQARGWAKWVASSGQVLNFSDHFGVLGQDDRAFWGELVASHRAVQTKTGSTFSS